MTIGLSVQSFGQNAGVSGKVTDNAGEPVVGAFVQEKGTQNATLTDANGAYSLKVAPKATLVFQNLGYVTQEVPTAGKSVVNVVLLEDVTLLNEAVAIGYGTLEKKMLTSSVASVSGKQLMPGKGDASIAQALRGKVANLQVSSTDSPNTDITLQLRGVASVCAAMNPLVVIDGLAGGDINSIIQEDVLSIDILKDAAASAIYGTRAAGGVILVTTKNADRLKEGTTSVTYTGEVSHKSDLSKSRLDLWDRDFYLNTYGQYYNAIDYGADTDWYKEIANNENLSQKHTLNFQAKSKVSSIYSTLQYSKNEGLAKFDTRDDITGRINADFHLLQGWLDVTARMEYRQAKRNANALDFSGVFGNPTRPIYDSEQPDGFAYDNNSNFNIVRERTYNTNDQLDKWFMPEASFKLNILPVEGLSIKQDFAYEFRGSDVMKYVSADSWSEIHAARKGSATIYRSTNEVVNIEGYANYANHFGLHNVSAAAGYSYNEVNGYHYSMNNYDFSNDGVKYWDIGEGSFLNTGNADMGSYKDVTTKLLAFFGRANYDYDGRYIAMASIRREASSALAAEKRWGTFWSLSGGWRVSAEPWMANTKDWLSDLKLRASYGVTGNCGFGSSAVAMYTTGEYPINMPNQKWAWAYQYDGNPNPDLKWEEQHGLNLGVDFSFLDNRIYGKFDWYNRKVVDMIYNIQVPQPPYACQYLTKNLGSLRNRGYEFEIGADVVRTSKVRYSTNMRFSHDNTQIITLDGAGDYKDFAELPGMGSGGGGYIRIEEGTVLGKFFMLECIGIDKEKGDFLISDRDGKTIYGSEAGDGDRKYVGDYIPFVQISWDHRLEVGNFELGLDLRSWIDFDVFNCTEFYHGLPIAGGLKRAYTKNAVLKNAVQNPSSYYLQDGTFLKIDALNLAYNIPIKKATNNFIKGIKAYVTINNLATFTKYEGMDPEVPITGLEAGFEYVEYRNGDNSSASVTMYPRCRNAIFGVQLSF